MELEETYNRCFDMQGISKARNVMTSRYAYKWKFVKNENGEIARAIWLRLVLRGLMNLEKLSMRGPFRARPDDPVRGC